MYLFCLYVTPCYMKRSVIKLPLYYYIMQQLYTSWLDYKQPLNHIIMNKTIIMFSPKNTKSIFTKNHKIIFLQIL